MFELEEYENSKRVFEAGKAVCSSDNAAGAAVYDRWIRKCDAELRDEEQKDQAAAKVASAPAVPAVAAAAAPGPVTVRYQHYQSDERVNLTVFVKNAAPAEVHVVFSAQHLTIVVRPAGVAQYTAFDSDLFDEVEPAQCSYVVKPTKIDVLLVKARRGVPWAAVERRAGSSTLPTAAAAASPAAAALPLPTTTTRAKAYASTRDWEKIDGEISRELEADKPEGEEALNKLFKDIYKNADEDTRRAMNKSFQTSGGTVLSTNWKEVHSKDYESEKQAPRGVEWKNWEGNKLPQKED